MGGRGFESPTNKVRTSAENEKAPLQGHSSKMVDRRGLRLRVREADPSLAGSVGRNAAQAPPAPEPNAFPPHRFESPTYPFWEIPKNEKAPLQGLAL